MTITTKFKKDITTLRSAVEGDFFLDVRNPINYISTNQAHFLQVDGNVYDVTQFYPLFN